MLEIDPCMLLFLILYPTKETIYCLNIYLINFRENKHNKDQREQTYALIRWSTQSEMK